MNYVGIVLHCAKKSVTCCEKFNLVKATKYLGVVVDHIMLKKLHNVNNYIYCKETVTWCKTRYFLTMQRTEQFLLLQ